VATDWTTSSKAQLVVDVTNSPSFEDAAVLEFFGASTRNHQGATMSVTTSEQTTSATAIRPFTVDVAQPEIDGLRARLAATRWPEKETVDDRSQGAQLTKLRPLTMPVLAIGGAASWGEAVGNAMKLAADDVQSVVIPDAGHWVAEQAPEEMLAALTAFLALYRDGG
jgi:pimeloyl-ACP methyl ester carboxylesterase